MSSFTQNLTQNPFTLGFVSGISFVLLLTPIIFWFNNWRKSIKSFFKPQTVVSTTKKSPAQVLGQSLMQVFWALVFLGVIVLTLKQLL